MDTTITLVTPTFTVYQDNEVEVTGFTISWDSFEKGDGELNISVDLNGRTEIDVESMDKEFFLDLMSKLYDIAEIK